MRILALDTENAPNLACTWGIHDQRISYDDIFQEWFFISAQWQFIGDKKVSHISVLDDPKRYKKDRTDDYVVVKKCHELIEECDIVIGHNIKGHDLKKLYAKFIEYGFTPPKEPFIVDTLQVSRKFGFTSRKLGDLCRKLELTQKLSHGKGLFLQAALGNQPAIKEIVTYGLGDIPTVIQLYNVLLPYITNHPNRNAFSTKACCPNCGGTKFQKRGRERGKQTYGCTACGTRFNEDKLKKVGKFL